LRWEAAETSVSNLDREQKEARLGALLTLEQLAEYKTTMRLTRGVGGPGPSYPPAMDWRSHQGYNWTTPVRDQGACGACVSFAVIGAMEPVYRYSQGQPNLTIDLSEAFLFFCGGGNCETGWYIPPALNFAKTTGVTDENCFPYPSPAHQESCDRRCHDWSNRSYKIISWQALSQSDQMKASISSKGPVITQMETYDDFYHYRSGVYAHATGDFLGHHAITVVGYDDNQNYWICKNSWGIGWGEGGWFRIQYGECGIATKFPMYTIEF